MGSSRSGWSSTLSDLVLGSLFGRSKSKCGSNRAVKSSSAELALWMWLEIVGFIGVGDLLRMLSGLSTISSGFGLG